MELAKIQKIRNISCFLIFVVMSATVPASAVLFGTKEPIDLIWIIPMWTALSAGLTFLGIIELFNLYMMNDEQWLRDCGQSGCTTIGLQPEEAADAMAAERKD